ncbi:MAG: phage tail sheath C-terminal domain-containing protein [Chloroflexota bacterium]
MPSNTLPGNMNTPGVYIHEVSGGSRPIHPVGSTTAGFVGQSPDQQGKKIKSEDLAAHPIDNWTQFKSHYFKTKNAWTNLAHAVYGFFLNGGSRCYVVDIGNSTDATGLTNGLNALATIDEIAIVAAPGFTKDTHYAAIVGHFSSNNLTDRVAILDAPQDADDAAKLSNLDIKSAQTARGMTAMYAPWLKVDSPNPSKDKDGLTVIGETVNVPPSGHAAGIWARSDGARGVAKAPANEIVMGAVDLTHKISAQTQTTLNNKGINAIRYFRDQGILVWGARTLATDQEWRYLNVRRLFNMVEESIGEGTRWVVFEPNDETLWAAIRRDAGAFLTDLWRQGMLMGTTTDEAFYVKCDAENNPPDSIRQGRVIIDIGIAPLFPTEFVVFRISQYESGTDVEIS